MLDTAIQEQYDKPCPKRKETDKDCRTHHPDRDLFCTLEYGHEGCHHAHGPDEECYAQWM